MEDEEERGQAELMLRKRQGASPGGGDEDSMTERQFGTINRRKRLNRQEAVKRLYNALLGMEDTSMEQQKRGKYCNHVLSFLWDK